MAPGSAVHDEEQALMQPQEVATCLVQEVWQTLRASLEAQARVALQHTATAPYYCAPGMQPLHPTVHCRNVHLVAHAVCR